MTLNKPDLHILTVWRIRLLLTALAPSFVSAYFSAYRNWIWWAFTCVWGAAFLYGYIFYYPIKFRKLSYALNKKSLLIHCGVIYTRVKAVPFTGIQYTSIASTPLERMFGVCSLVIYCAGSTAYIPGLPRADALSLQTALTATCSEGGAAHD